MLKEKLMEAIEARNNDVNSYIWKFAKDASRSQKEIKLVDATDEQLQAFYDHCNSMLYSKAKHNPGRYVLLDIIKEQREKCNVELYLRKLKEGAFTNGKSFPRNMYCQEILSCIRKNRDIFPQSELKNIPISAITNNVPTEFERLSIDSVITGCLDGLGTINTKHITRSFILGLGVYLNNKEVKEFTRKDENGKTRDRADVIKEFLGINPRSNLIIKSSGLSFTEFRAMLNLYSKKYSDLTTDQLVTLRNKVLFRLEQEVNHHIDSWEMRKKQIEKVCEMRGITLNNE